MSDLRADNTLFHKSEKANIESAAPLAVRMRPKTLDDFIGQRHFLGPGKLLTRMLQADRLSSLIFYGPPGVGKTSLATVIANHTRAKFNDGVYSIIDIFRIENGKIVEHWDVIQKVPEVSANPHPMF